MGWEDDLKSRVKTDEQKQREADAEAEANRRAGIAVTDGAFLEALDAIERVYQVLIRSGRCQGMEMAGNRRTLKSTPSVGLDRKGNSIELIVDGLVMSRLVYSPKEQAMVAEPGEGEPIHDVHDIVGRFLASHF